MTPKTKFNYHSVFEFGIDVSNSWVIEDHPSDVLERGIVEYQTDYLLTGYENRYFQ